MIKKLLFTFVCCAIQLISAQEEEATQQFGVLPSDIPVNNLVKYNRFYFNPTFSLVREDKKSINVYNKTQWTTFNDNPQTFLVNFTTNFEEKTGVSIGLYQQSEGIYRYFGGIANYAYNLEFGNDMNFTFGVNLAYSQSSIKSNIDASSINDGFTLNNGLTVNDPLILSYENQSVFLLSPGVNFNYGQFDAGVAVGNLVAYSLSGSELITDNMAFRGHVMYTHSLERRSDKLVRGKVYADMPAEGDLRYGLNGILEWPKLGWAQVGYNSFYGAALGIGGNITQNVSVGYTYETGFGDTSNFGATHEVGLAYNFQKEKRRRGRRKGSSRSVSPRDTEIKRLKKEVLEQNRIIRELRGRSGGDTLSRAQRKMSALERQIKEQEENQRTAARDAELKRIEDVRLLNKKREEEEERIRAKSRLEGINNQQNNPTGLAASELQRIEAEEAAREAEAARQQEAEESVQQKRAKQTAIALASKEVISLRKSEDKIEEQLRAARRVLAKIENEERDLEKQQPIQLNQLEVKRLSTVARIDEAITQKDEGKRLRAESELVAMNAEKDVLKARQGLERVETTKQKLEAQQKLERLEAEKKRLTATRQLSQSIAEQNEAAQQKAEQTIIRLKNDEIKLLAQQKSAQETIAQKIQIAQTNVSETETAQERAKVKAINLGTQNVVALQQEEQKINEQLQRLERVVASVTAEEKQLEQQQTLQLNQIEGKRLGVVKRIDEAIVQKEDGKRLAAESELVQVVAEKDLLAAQQNLKRIEVEQRRKAAEQELAKAIIDKKRLTAKRRLTQSFATQNGQEEAAARQELITLDSEEAKMLASKEVIETEIIQKLKTAQTTVAEAEKAQERAKQEAINIEAKSAVTLEQSEQKINEQLQRLEQVTTAVQEEEKQLKAQQLIQLNQLESKRLSVVQRIDEAIAQKQEGKRLESERELVQIVAEKDLLQAQQELKRIEVEQRRKAAEQELAKATIDKKRLIAKRRLTRSLSEQNVPEQQAAKQALILIDKEEAKLLSQQQTVDNEITQKLQEAKNTLADAQTAQERAKVEVISLASQNVIALKQQDVKITEQLQEAIKVLERVEAEAQQLEQQQTIQLEQLEAKRLGTQQRIDEAIAQNDDVKRIEAEKELKVIMTEKQFLEANQKVAKADASQKRIAAVQQIELLQIEQKQLYAHQKIEEQIAKKENTIEAQKELDRVEAETVKLLEAQETVRTKVEVQQRDARKVLEKVVSVQKIEEEKVDKEEVIRVAEEARLQEEAKAARLAEESRLQQEAEAARLAEEERLRQEAAAAEAAKLAEESRLQQEAEAARLAEEERLRQEAAAAEAAKLAEESRLQQEAEAARLAEEERLRQEAAAAEAAKLAEAKRLAEAAAASVPENEIEEIEEELNNSARITKRLKAKRDSLLNTSAAVDKIGFNGLIESLVSMDKDAGVAKSTDPVSSKRLKAKNKFIKFAETKRPEPQFATKYIAGYPEGFYLVGNVFKGGGYAEKFTEKLSDLGFDNAQVIENSENGLQYVSVGSYRTKSAAMEDYLSNMDNRFFGELWILKIAKNRVESYKKLLQETRLIKETVKDDTVLTENLSYIAGHNIDNGYYLITNIFKRENYFERGMQKLKDRGLEPQSFRNPKDNYIYVYLKRFDDLEEAKQSLFSNVGNSYDGDLYILKVQ